MEVRVIQDYPNYTISRDGQVFSTLSGRVLKPKGGKVKLYQCNGSADQKVETVVIADLVKQYFGAKIELDNCAEIFGRKYQYPELDNCGKTYARKSHYKPEATDYMVYYKHTQTGEFRVLNSLTDEITSQERKPYVGHCYELFKSYNASDDGLRQFKKDFDGWCDELKHNDILKIYYKTYYTHFFAVENTAKRLIKKQYFEMDKVELNEYRYLKAGFNAGIIFCDEECFKYSFGYDYSGFYPHLLVNPEFYIPIKAGRELILDALPSDLAYGKYHVNITCENPLFRRVFSFSPDAWYSHYSIQFALKYQERFGVVIELVCDGEVNAYVYDELVSGAEIFGEWFEKLMALKQLYPKNKLVKHLTSSLHGSLSKANIIHKRVDEAAEMDICYSDEAEYKILNLSVDMNGNEYYKLQNNESPQRYGFRLETFLTSFGRCVMGETILKLGVEDVIRVHTDGIVFKCEKDVSEFNGLSAEDKTTGMIYWKTVNTYWKLEDITLDNKDFFNYLAKK